MTRKVWKSNFSLAKHSEKGKVNGGDQFQSAGAFRAPAL